MNSSNAPRVCANCKWWEDDTHEGMGKCHYYPLDVRKSIEDWCAFFTFTSTKELQYDLNYPPYQVTCDIERCA